MIRRLSYGSFVTVAFDSGNPIFFISELAEHTKNLERDSRASLARLAKPTATAP
jgi:putative heme iron utilization protein